MSTIVMEEIVKRNEVNVRLDAEVGTGAKIVALAQEITPAGYFSELIRPLVRRDLEDAMQQPLKRTGGATRRQKGAES